MEEAASQRSPVIGRPVTPFTLPNQDEQPVTVPTKGDRWTVLYFYPKNDTPGCTCQATEFTDLLGRFHALDADVIGVSPDTTGNHRFFIAKYKLKLTLLSDPDHDVMAKYGAWADTQVAGVTVRRVIRTTFLIDPTGRIAWHWPEVIPEGHASRVKKRLESLQ